MVIGRGRISFSYDMIYYDIVSGLVITGTILLAFLVMVNYTFYTCKIMNHVLDLTSILYPDVFC